MSDLNVGDLVEITYPSYHCGEFGIVLLDGIERLGMNSGKHLFTIYEFSSGKYLFLFGDEIKKIS